MKTRLGIVRLLSCTLLCFSTARAESYAIDWFTIDGGGGQSTGGVFSVSGIVGQPDAGPTMSGGNYSVDGGFWSRLPVMQTPEAPRLHLSLTSSNTVLLAWPAPSDGFALQASATLAPAHWSHVTNAPIALGSELRVELSPLTGQRFFRLHKP